MSDFLSMSDADFMATGPAKLQEVQDAAAVEQPNAADTSQESVDEAARIAAEAANAAEVDENAAANAAAEADEEGKAALEGDQSQEGGALADDDGENVEAQPELGADGKPVTPAPAKGAETPADDTLSTGLPEGAERIFQTFRANGRDMQVKNVDEAIRLMQMGANYSQKQAAAKKDRAYVKVLEQNGLLDHEKLSYAVDLLAGKPEAIGKLLKDSKIDVHEIDEDKVAAYRAVSRAPSDNLLQLDEVVSSLEGNEHFNRLAGEMKTWDVQSQALLGNHPAALSQLTDQIQSGIYDKIMNEVNRKQVLGQLVGIPLMQAYNQIGQEMAEAGAFAAPAPAPKGPVTKLVTPGKKAPVVDKAAEERRRAAAPVKGVSTGTEAKAEPKFLAMSDEEFMKHQKR